MNYAHVWNEGFMIRFSLSKKCKIYFIGTSPTNTTCFIKICPVVFKSCPCLKIGPDPARGLSQKWLQIACTLQKWIFWLCGTKPQTSAHTVYVSFKLCLTRGKVKFCERFLISVLMYDQDFLYTFLYTFIFHNIIFAWQKDCLCFLSSVGLCS